MARPSQPQSTSPRRKRRRAAVSPTPTAQTAQQQHQEDGEQLEELPAQQQQQQVSEMSSQPQVGTGGLSHSSALAVSTHTTPMSAATQALPIPPPGAQGGHQKMRRTALNETATGGRAFPRQSFALDGSSGSTAEMEDILELQRLPQQQQGSGESLSELMMQEEEAGLSAGSQYAIEMIGEAAQAAMVNMRKQISDYVLAEQSVTDLLQRQRESNDKVRERVAQLDSSSGIIPALKLNVGGEHFTVPVRTLTQRERGATFFDILLGIRESEEGANVDDDDGASPIRLFTDAEGNVFIDRDPEVFRYVLNYLRGYTYFHLLDEEMLRKLRLDAKFFQLQGLVDLLGETESVSDIRFQPGPGVSLEGNRLRVVYSVAVMDEGFLITGRHRITFHVKAADYVGIGLISDTCVCADQEFHKTANSCVYYMSGVFYSNFPHLKKEDNLDKFESGDYVSLLVDMDKGYAEFTLKNSSKIVSIGRARRLRFAATLKFGSRIRIVPEEEAAMLPLVQAAAACGDEGGAGGEGEQEEERLFPYPQDPLSVLASSSSMR